MKLSIVSIYDSLVGYGKAFCETNVDVAIRTFDATIKHMSEHPEEYNTNPHDLSIYCVGDFDTETGLIKSFDSPIFLSSGTLIINVPDVKGVPLGFTPVDDDYNEVINDEEV